MSAVFNLLTEQILFSSMKYSWILFLIFTLPGWGQELYEQRAFNATNGHTLNYRILLPEDYNQDKKYPLVLFLHGAGERGNDNEKQLIHGSSMFLDPVFRNQHKAMVIFPQCPENSYWASMSIDRTAYPIKTDFIYPAQMTPPLESALDLVQHLVRDKHVDPKRLYIMGLSMGAMGTLEALYRRPKLFAAAIPICGGGNVDLAKKYARKLPLWLFHGDADAVVPVDFSRALYQRLTSLKATVRYTEYPGVNHNSWDKAFAEPELLSWLFNQQK